MFGQRATLPTDINIQKQSTKELIDDVNSDDVKTNELKKGKTCYR